MTIVIPLTISLAIIAQPLLSQPSASGSRQPFVASSTLTYLGEDGTETQFRHQFYQRADGSYSRVEDTEVHDSERGIRRYIALSESRSWTIVDSFTQSAITLSNLSSREFESMRVVPESCSLLEDGTWKRIGESERFGLSVVEVELRSSQNHIHRMLVAPALGCFPLSDTLLEHGQVRTKAVVDRLELRTPPADAFAVPFGYSFCNPNTVRGSVESSVQRQELLREGRSPQGRGAIPKGKSSVVPLLALAFGSRGSGIR